MALKAVRMVTVEDTGRKEIDIKRYAKVEKIPGGAIEDSVVLNGVMINKDITHPKMRRKIENPRIVLLDCPMEYKKGESMTNMELSKETDFSRVLELEEEAIKSMCDEIIKVRDYMESLKLSADQSKSLGRKWTPSFSSRIRCRMFV